MKPMKTPGVYIKEKTAFPNSVVQVATAVPAFIGHTEIAIKGNMSLKNVAGRISSMAEFHRYYGYGPDPKFTIAEHVPPKEDDVSELDNSDKGAAKKDSLPEASFSTKDVTYDIKQSSIRYALYGAMRLFFRNGGGPCYIVSIGSYQDALDADKMIDGIRLLTKEPEPTMLVIPETTLLTRANCVKVQQEMLVHCGDKMKNRIAILDIFGGYRDVNDPKGDPIATFRNDIGINQLSYGTAYYPWVNTSIFQSRDFSFKNVDEDSRELFIDLLKNSLREGLALEEELKAIAVQPKAMDVSASTEVGIAVTIPIVTDEQEIDPKSIKLLHADLDTDERRKTMASVGEWNVTTTGAITFQPLPAFSGEATIHYRAKTMGRVAVESEEVQQTLKPGNFPRKIDADDFDLTTIKLTGAGASDDGKTRVFENVGTVTVTQEGEFCFDKANGYEGPAPEIEYTIMTLKKDEVAAEDTGEKTITVTVGKGESTGEKVDKTLRAVVPLYVDVMNEITAYMNCMSPAAAMAGIYTLVDGSRGVWKAPANVTLNSVISPTVTLSHDDQEDLNVTPQGKSINAIRPFVGEGVLVWGARTLDGNSLDWRYVSVRRTMIMLEESIRLATKAYVFEPNTANTWVTIRSTIENFLTGIWKQGGLAGAVPEDAFSVHVGLGETMTSVDILEGILRITVLVAVSRPAEFVEISFQQQMQKS